MEYGDKLGQIHRAAPPGVSCSSGLNSAVFGASSQTAISFITGSHDVCEHDLQCRQPGLHHHASAIVGTLSLNGAGVVNNSSTTKPVLNVNSGGTLNFNGTASVGNATVSAGTSTLNFNGELFGGEWHHQHKRRVRCFL